MAMAPDEILAHTSMALVPAVASLVGVLLLRAVNRKSMSVLVSCLLFVAAVPVGMFLSFGLVSAFVHLLHGDGVLALVAAPVVGAMLTAPIALIFAVALAVITSKRGASTPTPQSSERNKPEENKEGQRETAPFHRSSR
jgi:hypothetical protein